MSQNDLLLVIDMQNVYRPGERWGCKNTEHIAVRIMDAIRSGAFHQVVFTRHIASSQPVGVWRNYNAIHADIIADSYANDIMIQFNDAIKTYPLFTKSVYSAMSIPEVQAYVSEADRVVVAGVVAECCVLSTVFSIIDAGKYVIWLNDCVAGTDEEREEAVRLVLKDLIKPHLCFMNLDEYLGRDRP